MRRCLIPACLLLTLAAPTPAGAAIPIDVRSAYLHLDTVDSAFAAVAVDLAALGFAPGYTITIATSGDWDPGPGGDVQTNLLVVFSSNATLLHRSLLHRVPGAIGTSYSNYSGGTWPNNEPTDIAEDFLVNAGGVTVTIPAGATRLFVSPADIYYRDNEDPDGDLGVTLTLVSATSVGEPGGPGPPLLLSARPNPFMASTSIAFQLERAGPIRVSVHDVSGRLVRTLRAGELSAGGHVVAWDGRDETGRRLPAGTYLARVAGNGRVSSRRLVLVR